MGTTLNGPWMKTKEEIEKLDNEGKIYWTTRGDVTLCKNISR